MNPNVHRHVRRKANREDAFNRKFHSSFQVRHLRPSVKTHKVRYTLPAGGYMWRNKAINEDQCGCCDGTMNSDAYPCIVHDFCGFQFHASCLVIFDDNPLCPRCCEYSGYDEHDRSVLHDDITAEQLQAATYMGAVFGKTYHGPTEPFFIFALNGKLTARSFDVVEQEHEKTFNRWYRIFTSPRHQERHNVNPIPFSCDYNKHDGTPAVANGFEYILNNNKFSTTLKCYTSMYYILNNKHVTIFFAFAQTSFNQIRISYFYAREDMLKIHWNKRM